MMGLFTPIYMQNNLKFKQEHKALEKVAAITDQDKLLRIALEAPLSIVATKAAEGLNDQNKLRRVALEAQSIYVRKAAVGKLADVGTLTSLAESEPDLFECCLSRLRALGEKQSAAQLFIGYEIGKETRSADHIKTVLKHIADQEILESVAGSARAAAIRITAVEQLKRQEALARIALEDRHPNVRRAAISNPNMKDSGTLARIALEDTNPNVRSAAISSPNMKDSGALARIVREDTDQSVRDAAVANAHLTDVEALSGIADDERLGTADNRWTAALRLSELAPERAVAPLVALLKKRGWEKADRDRLRSAIRFLEARYKNTADNGERERITGLPNGSYGYNWKGPCWHEDASVHFDIPR